MKITLGPLSNWKNVKRNVTLFDVLAWSAPFTIVSLMLVYSIAGKPTDTLIVILASIGAVVAGMFVFGLPIGYLVARRSQRHNEKHCGYEISDVLARVYLATDVTLERHEAVHLVTVPGPITVKNDSGTTFKMESSLNPVGYLSVDIAQVA